MTKIITKLPLTAETLEKILRPLEKNLDELCAAFQKRFDADEWIKMGNKDVYYINDIAAIMPNLDSRMFYYQYGNYNYDTNGLKERLKFDGFDGDLPTEGEVKKCFNDKLKYFRYGGNHYIIVNHGNNQCNGLTFKKGNEYWYMFVYNNSDRYKINQHGGWKSDPMWTIPIFRFNGEDSAKVIAAAAIFYWLENKLTPENFGDDKFKNIFLELTKLFSKYKGCIKVDGSKIIFDRQKILDAVIAGTAFDFGKFFNEFKADLLNGDKIRADLDPYDENILRDPNRGHWDLWDYGADFEKVGEINLPESLTARNPADDINHGIVAIDFGTKSTVVVYENDHLQILPIQVGNGKYGEGVKAENYENPTVIQFIDVESFVAAYNARNGRPKTKWDWVTVSHTAFDNLTNSDSKHYYSFLTDLKHWCGSEDKIKLKDREGVTKDLPPFSEVDEGDLNPIEYYAYYLGLYINNMLQEKRIFLKYIMSFPVTYDKAITYRMRQAFSRGLKKSFPTALLSNAELMKNFSVQEGASEPAAYAITALQEYGFDPEGTEENYYAVFDFGGGTTDFDFGVFRESSLDRYDYDLIHFGENGDRTLGGENLLKLLAYEIFKANISTLLNPDPKNKGNEKIPFTFDAEKKNFVGSDALIKSSQEANANMHNLCEKLRPIWENPQGDAAKKILESGSIEVNLFTDKGNPLANIQLKIIDKSKNINVDLQKILRDRIEQGIRNFFIAMKEAFTKTADARSASIRPYGKVEEISIFLAGNSSKSALVKEIFNEYIGKVESVPADKYTKVLMHFNESPTKDDCGNVWESYDSPTISSKNAKFGNALQCNGSYVVTQNFTLGGQDFTIDFWAYIDSATATYSRLFELYFSDLNNPRIYIHGSELHFCVGGIYGTTGFSTNRLMHLAAVYSHSEKIFKLFIDGVLKITINVTIEKTTYNYLGIGCNFQDNGGKPGRTKNNNFVGTIGEFRISDGIARWTNNFTPPNEMYSLEKTALKIPKSQEIFGLSNEKMPKFKIFPALGTESARKLQIENGVEVNPNDIAAPTGKTGVAFGLLRCRDSGNVKIVHLTPDKNKTPFQFYVGRNKKRKFKTVIDKSTKFETWYPFIDAGNNFDILYSDKPEASSNQMDVQKAKCVTVTLDKKQINPEFTVFIRAVKSNAIEYQIAEKLEDLTDAEKMKGVEPKQIILE